MPRLFALQRRPFLIIMLLIAVFGAATTTFAQPNERTRKVLEDKERVSADGFWIYNDLPTAFAQAKETGKPLLVVLRCLPCTECVKLDDEVVDRDPIIRPLLEKFVCVRVVSTNGLDLSLFQFDTDQSFAVFLLRDAETIYGRFGTRSHRTDWIGDVSLTGFAEAMRGALEMHAAWPRDAEAIKAKRGPVPAITRPEEFPSLKQKYAYTSSLDYRGDVVRSCIHCHQIGDAIRDEIRARGEPMPESVLFPYPHPKSIGLILDPNSRGTVKAVTPDSPADRAGFRPGDAVTGVNSQPILSIADVQWALHHVAPEGATVHWQVERAGAVQAIPVELEAGWRRQDDISWRVSTWGMRRMATGGLRLDELTTQERESLPTKIGPMALRVKTVGQYGPHAAAKQAGFQVGDILLSIDDKTDFQSEIDVIRYGVTAKRPGEFADVEILRGDQKKRLKLPMQN